MTRLMKFVSISLGCGLLATTSLAQQQMSVDEQLAAKARVQTAVALAEIAEAEGDGDALLVAARLLASAGPVAKRGENGDTPALYSVEDLAAAAKALGADAAKADAVAETARAPLEPSYCYWEYKCNTFDCAWVYIC